MPAAWRPRQSPPAASAASKRGEEAARHRPRGVFERGDHRLPDRPAAPRSWPERTRPRRSDARRRGCIARPCGPRPSPVACEHGDLADLGVRIRREECGERLFGRLAAPHQLEPERPVASLAVGLRRHRAYAGLGPGHDGARRGTRATAPPTPSSPLSLSRATIEYVNPAARAARRVPRPRSRPAGRPGRRP